MKVLSMLLLFQLTTAHEITIQFHESSKTIVYTVMEGSRGEGDSSFVFRAKDPMDTQVALKIAKRDDIKFFKEMEIYKLLGAVVGDDKSEEARNSGVPLVHGHGQVVEQTFDNPIVNNMDVLVIELFGTNLHDTFHNVPIIRGQLSSTEWIIVGYQMLVALNFVHRAGVTHGDVKPENYVFHVVGYDNVFLVNYDHAIINGEASYFVPPTVCYQSYRLEHLLHTEIEALNAGSPIQILMVDDLESFVISAFQVRTPLPWAKIDEKRVQLSQMKKEDLEKKEITEEQFKKDINSASKLTRELKANLINHIEKDFGDRNENPALIALLVDIVNFARKNMTHHAESLEMVVEMEKFFLTRWRALLPVSHEETMNVGRSPFPTDDVGSPSETNNAGGPSETLNAWGSSKQIEVARPAQSNAKGEILEEKLAEGMSKNVGAGSGQIIQNSKKLNTKRSAFCGIFSKNTGSVDE